jgi:autotransporter-associated beta strand protein
VPSGLTRLCSALIFLVTASFTPAATWTWTGLGGNVNWNTGSNWSPGTIPASASTTDLIFAGTTNTGTALVPLNQNIATPFLLNNLTFAAGAGSFYLGGGAMRFDGGNSNSITQTSSSAQSIANAFDAPSSNGRVTLTLDGGGSGVVTMSGVISAGSGHRDYAIEKTGASTFSLTGTNTYAGGTTISGGTLIVNSAASLGHNSGGLIMNAGTLEVAASFSSSRAITLNSAASTFLIDPAQTYTVTSGITGTGALNKTGTGTMVLSGANTYSGGTIISAGTLRLGSADRLLNTGAITVSGGTFDLQTFSETVGVVTLSSGSIIGTGTLTGSAYAFQAGTVSAPLGGTAALTKTTAGTLTLSGANSYSGGTTINGGTVIINSSANLGNVAGALTINAGTLEIATGFTTDRVISLGDVASTFQIDPGVTFTVSSSISGTGALNKTGSGTMALNGANTYSGGTVVSAGTLRINSNERIANTSDLTVAGGTFNVQTFSETVANVTLSSGSITGTGAGTLTASTFTLESGSASAILAGSGATMTKTTAGTVTLTGANTFTGATTIDGGTLTASASSGSALGATSSVTVNSGGTLLLGANNQINNTATITLAGGTLDKGNFSEGSASTPGVGPLTLTASGSQIDFGSGTVGVLTFASFTPGSFTLTINNWTGTPGGVGSGSTDRLIFNSDQSANLSSFAFTGFAGAMEFDLGNGYYEITPLTAVPEPSTYFAAGLALALVVFQQARRFRRTSKRA